MQCNLTIVAGISVKRSHHQAIIDTFGELFVDKLFEEKKAFRLDDETYVIGIEVPTRRLSEFGFQRISSGVCMEYSQMVNTFVGSIDKRLLFTIAEVEDDSRNAIWLINGDK